MSIGSKLNRIKMYVRYGPAYGDSFIQKTLGVWLFWKLWIAIVLMFAGLIMAGSILGERGVIGFFIGLFTAQFMHIITE